MQQLRRLDGRRLIPADTRNKCVEALHDYCPKGKWIVKVLNGWRDRLEAGFPQGGVQCGWREDAVSLRAL
jgi:hypothetical protein